MSIRKYALGGDNETVYGAGFGQGPGQFQNIFSFWSRDSGDLWVIDSGSRRISRFEPDGQFANSFQVDFMPGRIAEIGKNRLAVLMYMQPTAFAIMTEDGTVQDRRGVFDESISFHSPIFDGHIFPGIDGGIIWAARFASILYFFDQDMLLERRVRLIDGYDFPVDHFESFQRGEPLASLDHPHRTMAVSTDGEHVFVNTLVRESETAYNVMDRYDFATGKYRDSARIPRGGNQYHVHDGIIYGTGADTTFRAFRFSIPN